MSCWLWNLVTGDMVLVAREVCYWLAPVGQYLQDPMWGQGG